jgi:hypothetical protein
METNMMSFNPYQHDLFTKYRRTDPVTSRQAAEEVIDKITDIQQKVLNYALDRGYTGFTDEQLNFYFNTHKSTYRSRRAELVKKGLIVDSGTTRDKMTVWVHKEFSND